MPHTNEIKMTDTILDLPSSFVLFSNYAEELTLEAQSASQNPEEDPEYLKFLLDRASYFMDTTSLTMRMRTSIAFSTL